MLQKIVVLCLLTPTLWAQGINWRKENPNQLFEEAKRSGKPVMVEIYSPNCHVCQSFYPSLNSAEIGSYYNSHFINTRLDGDNPAALAFVNEHRLNVPSLPIFLFFDPDKTLIHSIGSSNSKKDFLLEQGRIAADAKRRGQSLKSRYQQGERGKDFLVDLATFSRLTKDTVTLNAAMNDYAKQLSPDAYATQPNFMLLQKMVLDYQNPMAQYFFANLNKFNAFRAYGNPREAAEHILAASLNSRQAATYSPEQVQEIRGLLTKVGVSAKEAANLTLMPALNANFRARKPQQAVERMEEQMQAGTFSTPEYLYVIRVFNRRSPDGSYAPAAVRWFDKAMALKPTPREQADLYYELSEAYRRGKDKANALKAAEKALDLAKQTGITRARNHKQIYRLQHL